MVTNVIVDQKYNETQIRTLSQQDFRIFATPKPLPMNRCQPYRPMNPFTGILPSRGNARGYRYASPDGDGWAVVATAAHFLTQSPSDHCSLITVHSSYTFSAKERDSETGLSYFGSRYYSSALSIWLSVDPMSDKYPSMSPYVYCADNPVKLVDPNGEEVLIYGKAKRAFFREVKKGARELGLFVKMDRFGKLSAKYNGKGPISEHGQLLLNAIEDRTVKINIEAVKNESGTLTDYMFGGAFGGNVLIPQLTDGNWCFLSAIAKQTVIPSDLKILDYYYESPGQSSLHEITEAYNGAMIALNGIIFSSETGSNSPLFSPAHNSAIPQSGIVMRGIFYENGTSVSDLDAFKGKGYIEWQTVNGELLKTSDINTDDLNKIFK